jgi:hypothetical protein
VSDAVRGTAGYSGGYWTVIGRSDRLFCYCTQTENTKDSEESAARECTVRMHSGWTVAARYSPRNFAHAHISHS